MRSTIISLATMAGLAAAQFPTTCTVPTVTFGGALATITQTFTSTYCPVCPSVVTTYTTQYQAFCPTGYQGNVYTVTETCAPGNCRTGIPPGFVTTVSACNVCGPTPITTTLTQPATTGSYATVTQYYPVAYQAFGSSGLAPTTYTVTASCAAAPCPTPMSGAPQGFGTTVATCNTCGPTPVTATLTIPTAVAAVSAVTPATGGSNSPAQGGSNSPAQGGNSPAQGGAATPASNKPATYTGAASNNNAGSYLAAGFAGVAAVAQLL